jgi:hypothetical protein
MTRKIVPSPSEKNKKVNNYARLFEAFGVSFISNGDPINLHAEACPFCGGEKFAVNVSEGTYQCMNANRCGAKGNAYTFIRWVHETALEKTTDKDYRRLKDTLGLPLQTLKLHQLAWYEDHWLIPYKSVKGKIVNLFHYYTEDKSKRRSLPCLKLCLYGVDQLPPEAERGERTLFVCEGVPDLMALDYHLRSKIKTRTRYDLIAVPSANVFRPAWLAHLKGYKAVRLCLDNDKAGRDGQERITKMVRESKEPIKLFALRWPDDPDNYPEKCDLRDLVAAGVNVVKFTRQHCLPVTTSKPPFRLVRLDAVGQPDISWFWGEHIPYGSFISFQGGMGEFKSTICRDLAARISAGKPMPNSDKAQKPRDVIIFTSEDSAAKVKAIIKLHGGDETRVHVHDIAASEGESVNLLEHIAFFEEEIKRLQAGLVVIDALNSFADGDYSSDTKARRSISGPLQNLARKTGAAIIGIRNLGRDSKGKGSDGALGAISLAHVSRCAMNTKELPLKRFDPTRRFLLEFERVSDAPKPAPVPYSILDRSTGEHDRYLCQVIWHPVGYFDGYLLEMNEDQQAALETALTNAAKNGSKKR